MTKTQTRFTCSHCGRRKSIRRRVGFCLDTISNSFSWCVDCFGKASVDPEFRARVVR